MSKSNQFTRRSLLKTAGGIALVSGMSAPIFCARKRRRHPDRPPDAAHRLPRPARRICRDGGRPRGRGDQRRRRRHRPQDRAAEGGFGQSADRLDQGRAHDRARQGRLHRRRDLVGLLPDDRAGRARAPRTSSSTPAAIPTRCAARTATRYMFHVEQQNSMYVKTVGRSLLRAGSGQGQEVVLADRRLRVRP